MPVKAIAIAVAAVITAGIVIYDNRDHITDFLDRSRRKLAISLHTLADQVHNDQRLREQSYEAPLSGRHFEPSSSFLRRDSSSSQTLNEKYEEDRGRTGEATGTGLGRSTNEHSTLRHRGGDFTGQSTLLFDAESEASSVHNEKLIGTAPPSRRSSSATLSAGFEKPLPPPPPPVESPFESGYESQHPAPPPVAVQERALSSRTASDAEGAPHNPFENSQPYWSIQSWAEQTSSAHSSSPSLAGSAAEEIDAISDIASVIESVDSWSEVGSDVSGDAH